MSSDSMSPSRVVALALAVGTLFTVQAMLTSLAAGRPVDVGSTVVLALLFWVVWAFLTPVVLAAVRRWPLDTKPIYRSIVLHAGISIVLSVVQTILALGLRSLALYLRGALGASQALAAIASPVTLGWGVFTGVFFYWVIAVVHTALRFRDLYVSERVSAAALETELTRSKLDALRSQLRPHFLFNTLNAISGLMPEGADKPRHMLLRLSSLLRRSLDEEAHEVPLQQELAFLNDYLDIQRVRFGSRLTVQLAVDPAVLPARVPVFLLQPLLENAIEHGEGDDGRTTIALSAARDGDVLHVTVEDDGPGIAISASMREGVGLRNTRDGEGLLLLEPSQVDWIESAGNYVRVHSGARAYLTRTTMDRVARRLTAGGNFIRVRRSALINVRALAKIERYGKGTFVVYLRNGAKVISGRFYHPELRRLLRPEG